MSPGRQKAMEIVNEFRAAILGADLDDEDFIRDAFLMTIEQEKAFREKYGQKLDNANTMGKKIGAGTNRLLHRKTPIGYKTTTEN